MSEKEKIIEFCKSLGLDAVGVCQCRVFEELRGFFQERKDKGLENEFEEENIEKRVNPFYYMEDGKSIISIAFPYLFDTDFEGDIYFSKYTQGEDYHKVLSAYLQKICNFIEDLGGRARHFVDSNALPERYIAKLSGVGFIGKNNMLITEKYGSYVFLGEIITDLYLEPDSEKVQKCEGCNKCLKACPTSAVAEELNTPNVCLSYITQKKNIEDQWLSKLGGRIFGCDTCQRACPYNINIHPSSLGEFIPKEYMKNADLNELINIDNKIFKEKYVHSSCGWRGKNILQRNAIINMFYLEKNEKVQLKPVNSPYIKEYYDRLLNSLNL